MPSTPKPDLLPSLWDLSKFASHRKAPIATVLKAAIEQHKVRVEADETRLLFAFLAALEKIGPLCKAQIYQDAFAAVVTSPQADKTFLEFGATDGVSLSNSHTLETRLGWRGVLAEPSPQWHKALRENRPDTTILTECIWSRSGEELDFFVSDVGVLSTLEAYRTSDAEGLKANANKRNESGTTVTVTTISLNDVMEQHFDAKAPSFLSIDTEGSEFDILSVFDFGAYRPIAATVEHNFTSAEKNLDTLFSEAGYRRVFREITAFDAWYLRNDVFDQVRVVT